jgi:D-tagatose-1,6-bisphosphate aldolase subunit GatZ/KbaZ
MSKPNKTLKQIIAKHKLGEPIGIFSVCSANPTMIETSLKFAAERDIPILIESTCNQVNQFGGYTGMVPHQFADLVWQLAAKYSLPKRNITLGGDHMGPYPWKDEPAQAAMAKASQMVHDYVKAGYTKIHLDASMKCADDEPNQPLDRQLSAKRAAELCSAAENAAEKAGITEEMAYVIGTEVPLPGGTEAEENALQVTSVEDVRATVEYTKQAFFSQGLQKAWPRVIAVVTQPGVEYGNNVIFHYQREKAALLSRFIAEDKHLIYEAHSTDYQLQNALKQLVEDHFSILKVGPELTFAYREAIFALEFIEKEIFSARAGIKLSNLREVVDTVMVENPEYWEKYYQGTVEEQAFARKYSFSDRIRYYWPNPIIQTALHRLFANLESEELPLPLISQYFSHQYHSLRQGVPINPNLMVEEKIREVLEKYALACGYD